MSEFIGKYPTKENENNEVILSINDPIIKERNPTHMQIFNRFYDYHFEGTDKITERNKITICDAIFMYQSIFYSYVNGILSGKNPYKNITDRNALRLISEIVKVFDDYFSGFDTNSSKITYVYRGEKTHCGDNKNQPPSVETCRVGQMSSFTSTSTSWKSALSFTGKDCCIYRYKLNNKVPYIDVNYIMSNSEEFCNVPRKNRFMDEKEIILPRGIKLSNPSETKDTYTYYYKNVDNSFDKITLKIFEVDVSYEPNYLEQHPNPIHNKLVEMDNKEALSFIPVPPTTVLTNSSMPPAPPTGGNNKTNINPKNHVLKKMKKSNKVKKNCKIKKIKRTKKQKCKKIISTK